MHITANNLLPLSPSNHMQYFNTFLFCNCWYGIKDSLEINFSNILISLENGFVDWAKLWNKMSIGYILCVCVLILYHFDYMIIAVHLFTYYVCIVLQIPLWVVLAIPPFNYLVNPAVSKIAPALITRNSIVLKPPTP